MAVPKYSDFFPVFMEFLSDGNEHTLQEVRDYCASKFDLSEEDKRATFSNGLNMLTYRLGWTQTHLKKAGLITNPKRAVIAITPFGKEEILSKGIGVFTLEYVRELQQQKSDTSTSSTISTNSSTIENSAIPEPEEQTPQEMIDASMEQLNLELADKLLDELTRMDEYDFEHVIVDLLLKMGYGKPEENQDAVTRKSGDGGIDGVVRADRFGFDAIYTQAKRWKEDSHVQRPDIQKFLGAMVSIGATKGLFITTGQFSKGALDFAEQNHNHKIVLVDGKKLAELMIEYDLGVTTVKTYEIKRVDSDYFSADS